MTVRNSVGQQAQSIYSDDHGITWHAGNPVGRMMDENKVVELSDGTSCSIPGTQPVPVGAKWPIPKTVA
ncbi:sialidase [Cutibacterium acnes JCM 18916]|nr:sialidase [Cutibacterium acnes JCM 18916]